jgi:hypothetical protein
VRVAYDKRTDRNMESRRLFGHPLSRNFKSCLRESVEANEPWFGILF